MENLMFALMFIANSINPQLGVPGELPKIEYVTACELYEKIESKPCPDDLENRMRPLAAYFNDSDTIVLVDGFDMDSPLDQSILMHELVHYAQDVSGQALLRQLQGSCINEAWEKDAYDVQFTWLRQIGFDPEELTGVDPITLKFLTTCGSYY